MCVRVGSIFIDSKTSILTVVFTHVFFPSASIRYICLRVCVCRSLPFASVAVWLVCIFSSVCRPPPYFSFFFFSQICVRLSAYLLVCSPFFILPFQSLSLLSLPFSLSHCPLTPKNTKQPYLHVHSHPTFTPHFYSRPPHSSLSLSPPLLILSFSVPFNRLEHSQPTYSSTYTPSHSQNKRSLGLVPLQNSLIPYTSDRFRNSYQQTRPTLTKPKKQEATILKPPCPIQQQTNKRLRYTQSQPYRNFLFVSAKQQVQKGRTHTRPTRKTTMLKFAKPSRTTGQNLVGLWRPSFTRVDQKLYLFGGGGHVTNDLHVLDLVTMHWDCIVAKDGVPPTKRYGHTAVLWNQNIIIFGGANEYTDYRDDVIMFSLQTRTWSRPEIRGEVPARYLHSATVYRNKMYVYGGFAKNSKCTYVLEEMRILNLETWTWSDAYTVPARYNHSASLIGSKLWIYAGKDEAGNTVSDLYSIDLVTLRVLPHTGITGKVVLLKSQHFSESIGNQLVVFGKYPNEATQTSLYCLWIMDLDQLEWRKLDVDQCLENGVWNYFTIVSKKAQQTPRLESGDDMDCGMDLDEDESTPRLVFLGNTEKDRPQPYDHFREVLSINVEYLGVFQIPPSNLQSQLRMMLDNEEFSDFTVIAKGSSRKIHVHRMVLSTRWPHFRNMNASGMIESKQGSMTLPEPYPVVYAFLSFLYTDTVDSELEYSVVCDVMVMANMYLLERLKKLCASILHRYHLQIDTCVRIFQAACVSQEHGLKKLSQEFIFRHCGAVMKTDDWMLMWSGGADGSSGEQRAALEEFIDGVPEEASLETAPGSRQTSEGYGAGYDSAANFEPSLRKDVP